MEPKKNPVYDVHHYRPVIFGISLSVSLLIVIVVFEWSVEKVNRPPTLKELVQASFLPLEYPIHNFKEELPKQAKRPNPERIVEVKNDPVVFRDEPEIRLEPEPNTGTDVPIYYDPLPVEIVPEDTFRIVECMPLPEGGYEGFYKMMSKSMKYPKKAQRNLTQGKVYVEFTVSKIGSITNMKILKGVGDGCDEEAMRVIALGRWKPGKQRGTPVNVRMVQTIDFRLQ